MTTHSATLPTMPSALGPTGSTRAWRRTRAAVLTRDHHRCQVPLDDGGICAAPATHAGHITARHHDGDDNPDNLRAECARHSHTGGALIADNNHRHHTSAPSRWYHAPTLAVETRHLRATR